MNELVIELLELVEENPDLPIVPMTDSQLCCRDGYGFFMGQWNDVQIDEFIIGPDNKIYFKSTDDIFDVLENYLSEEDWNALPETEEEVRPYYDALPWTKAIIVYIVLPED